MEWTEPPPCNLLVFVTTQTEEDVLCEALRERRLDDAPRESSIGAWFDVGTLGANRVVAVRTRIGSHRFGGAAWSAILFKQLTGATGLLAVGMAFGTMPGAQKLGDVLVATSVVAYDARRKREQSGVVVTDYPLLTPRRCRASLIEAMRRESQRRSEHSSAPAVHFGPMLSGGAQIQSRSYRDRLVSGVPTKDGLPIGGDMEGVGLLAASDPDDPGLIVVKGISDFADDPSGKVVEENRQVACRNALHFVLGALERRG